MLTQLKIRAKHNIIMLVDKKKMELNPGLEPKL